MPSTPIAYNTGSPITGTTQTGSLAVGSTAQPYCNNIGGLKWWMGPEESTGYVIGKPVPAGNQPTPVEVSASVGFNRSKLKTDASFISLVNNVFRQSITSSFTNATSASNWLTSNGYWNTYRNYQVGDLALGGIIAYILQPGDPGYDAHTQHGLVTTLNDISTGSIWGCSGTEISGANGEGLGTGAANTAAIVSGCATAGIAARLCSDLVEGGYSDWYLPSRDEMEKLNQNQGAIGNLDGINYQTSTQYYLFPSTNIWWINFIPVNGQSHTSKTFEAWVRPVRSF
jgi:hypothetical protein